MIITIIKNIQTNGVEATIRDINQALKTIDATKHGLYECDMIMTPSEYKKALKEEPIWGSRWGINYGSEVQNDN